MLPTRGIEKAGQKEFPPLYWLIDPLDALWLRLSAGSIFAAYLVTLLMFALIYWRLGVHSHAGESPLQAFWDSLLVSLSAIQGRTVFEQLGAWSTAAWVAAGESVFGILLEGIFVAMLIQRFFAR
jgi:hypothetical protein